jgi:hypothetical protein
MDEGVFLTLRVGAMALTTIVAIYYTGARKLPRLRCFNQ